MGSAMSGLVEAYPYTNLAKKFRRLAAATRDPHTAKALGDLADEYEAKAIALDQGDERSP